MHDYGREFDVQVSSKPHRGPQRLKQVFVWRGAEGILFHFFSKELFFPKQSSSIPVVSNPSWPLKMGGFFNKKC